MNSFYGVLVLPAGGFPLNHAQKLATSTKRGALGQITSFIATIPCRWPRVSLD